MRHVIKVSSPGKLRPFLAAELDLSLRKVKTIIDQRCVWINRQCIWMANHLLQEGEQITWYSDCLEIPSLADPLPILFEDDDLLILNKPAFRTTVGKQSVQTWLERQRPDMTINVVHRLDRETTGCLLVGKNKRVIEDLSRQFRDREVEKTYQARVSGKVTWSRKTLRRRVNDRSAISECICLETSPVSSMIEVKPVTGRKHQIRVHLEGAGHPLVGEKEYSFGGVAPRHLLHARRIAFRHPVSGDLIDVSAPVPRDMSDPIDPIGPSDRIKPVPFSGNAGNAGNSGKPHKKSNSKPRRSNARPPRRKGRPNRSQNQKGQRNGQRNGGKGQKGRSSHR